VLTRQQNTFGDNHDETPDTMYCISRVLEEMKSMSAESNAKAMASTSRGMFNDGRHSEALMVDQQRVDLLMKSKGEDHPDTIVAQFNVAMSLSKLDRHEESLALVKKVLPKAKVVYGIDHPSTLNVMHNLAAVLMKFKRYEESLTMFEDVFERSTRCLGADHPETLLTVNNIA
jgi:hypothetical protein